MEILMHPVKWTRGFLKKCYDFMLELSVSKKAIYFLGAISFIESSFFPIPPDVMIIPMVLAAPKSAWKIAGVATAASVVGGYFGYAIGYWGYEVVAEPILDFYGYMDAFNEFKKYYAEYGLWIVFIAGVTPFPYKVITITSGVMGLDLVVFGVASVLARGARFYFVAWLLKKYGAPIKVFIEKHLGKLSVAFVVILIGSFYLIKYL